ncbi:proteasome activator Blm10p [[Candida] jaroonii]|uniref:Proteasome activator Blm10p n=1 Tax=[Candida] jaroonii TaxID=467808 RepID=A0ACA9Y755_9ASCO|nr:proteasome activator Blm10p [[Candida] jaroonii]
MTDPKSNEKLPAPIPVRHVDGLKRGQYNDFRSQTSLDVHNDINGNEGFRSLTPNTSKRVQNRRPSYSSIEISRESHYNLDYPEDVEEIKNLQLDPKSRFYARDRPRTLDLPKLLPYETELPKDQAKFLSHIVSHLYIAIKTLDLQGALSVSAKDLAALKNTSGLSDLDIALETNLFEMDSSTSENVFPDDNEPGELDYVDDAMDEDEDDEEDEEEEEDEEDDEEGNYSEDEEKDRNESASQHKKSPKSAAVVGVRIWTSELLVWLKMKYDMPVTLRIALAKVYYSICLSRGQFINLKGYVRAFDYLTKDVSFLRKNGLVLGWESLYHEITNHFLTPDATIDPFEKKDFKQLNKLAEKASQFFDEKALPEIYSKLGQNISISNSAFVINSMVMLPLSFNDPNDIYDIRYYIASFFYMWEKFYKNNDLDSHLTTRLGTISKASLSVLNDKPQSIEIGKFGVFKEDQFEILINNLLNNLSISPRKFSSNSSNYFHGYSSAIIYSINGDTALEENGILNSLQTLVNAIESYVHPTNSGEWTKPISKLIYSLVYHMHKRYNSEVEEFGDLNNIPQHIKMTKNVVNKFVEIFLPVVRIGLQSKKSSSVDSYLNSLQALAHLNPEYVLEHVLLDLYESLEGVISTHRVIVAIRAFEELARYFSHTKIFRVHVTKLLSLAIPGIDSNDLEKSAHALNLFETIANFTPIYDLTNGEGDANLALQFTESHVQHLQMKIYRTNELGDDIMGGGNFEIDDETEIESLKSSTTAFKPLIKSLLQRVFTLLENLPDPNKSGKMERGISDAIPKFLYIIFQSVSKDIFKMARDLVFDFAFDNTIHTVADVMAEICGSLIKCDPQAFPQYCDVLIERIKEAIEENGSGKSRTGVDIVPRDQPLFWNLVILNECIGNAQTYVLKRAKELTEFINYLMDNVRGPTVFASAYIINQTLQSITKIKLSESRLISPQYEAKYGVDSTCWGGFQFDKNRFDDEHLGFSWFLPTDKEVDFAVDLFTELSSKILGNISTLMKDYNKDKKKDATSILSLTDELRNNFLYLSYGLSGISFLLDPSFEEDIPKLNQHQNETIHQRLLLLKQIRSVKNEKIGGKDELRIENLQENLQKIIEDMTNDDEIERMNIHDIDETKTSPEDDDKMEVDDDIPDKKDINSDKKDLDTIAHESLEYSKKHLFDMERSTSPEAKELPSRASPGIEGVALSQMNPGITFRERKLYTSRYFFGDDMDTRRSNDSYIKLHRYRYLIGRSLHIICKFLMAHFHDNTKLFKHFLFTVNTWFSDVGRERLLDTSHAKVVYDMITFVQGINKVRKPFSRIAIGSRIEAYHSLRVVLHSTSRTQTDLDKLLLEDLVKLSLSTYSTVSKPAQTSLIDAMKRLNGSYNVIIKSSLKYLSKSIDENDAKKIESGLNLFNLKRIRYKVQNDYFNLNKFVTLLHRCLAFDIREVNVLAQTLFKGIAKHLTAPSSICLMDMKAIDAIRPPDEFIDLEIKAVKLAKEKKRELYLEKLKKLEATVIASEAGVNHWKTSLLNLSLLVELQLDLEMPNNNEVMKILASQANSDLPVISRLASRGIYKLINDIYLHQLIDYKLENAFDFNYLLKDHEIISTVGSPSFYNDWKKEMANNSHSQYFVDNKSNIGWLFWGESMKVVKNQPDYDINLNDSDTQAVNILGNYITKDWLHEIVKLWVTDNETTSVYQATDVYFIQTIVLLIANGYCPNLCFEDVFQVVEDIYETDDKASHIVTCEILAGLLISSKVLNQQLQAKRDEFIVRFINNIFNNDLSPDTSGIWNVFSWWIPTHIDHRRFPAITDVITKFRIDRSSDFAFRDATRLNYVKAFVASTTWKFAEPDDIMQMCLDNIDHHYQAVRDQVGQLLGILTYVYYPDSFQNFKTFTQQCNEGVIQARKPTSLEISQVLPKIFQQIEDWRLQTMGKTPQEILKTSYIYSATTVLTWLKQSLVYSTAIYYEDFAVDEIVPFLLKLISLKEVCQLGNIDPITVLKLTSQIPFNFKNISKVVDMLNNYSKEKSLNVVQSIVIGEFTETFYFKNLFKLTPQQRDIIINFTNELLFHKQVSVRESASSTLSGLIHISPPTEVESIVKKYSLTYKQTLDKVRRKYRKAGNGYKNMAPEDLISLHGSTLGLGALIHAFSFLSPPPIWVPELLEILATKSSGIPGLVGKTAKDSLSKFKKTRQDTWHIDREVFTESQMQDLEGVLIKSYFI